MKIPLKDFPHQPKKMPCCVECKAKDKKDCEINPMDCHDFYIWNMEFINSKLET